VDPLLATEGFQSKIFALSMLKIIKGEEGEEGEEGGSSKNF
jgi:hypothetical protein